MMRLFVFAVILTISSSQELQSPSPVNKSYVCPPHFIRMGHRCYFFSKEAITWSEALFQCRELHSNLAIIQNKNQDKLIRNFLDKKTLEPLERWLGGMYDWGTMAWKWGASGKALAYNGFPKEQPQQDPETLRWHCIILDPAQEYLWSSRSCVENKHYICQTKLKKVNNRDKKKLQRQYKADKDNKLNQIPVPLIPESAGNETSWKYKSVPITYRFEVNEKLSDQALFAYQSPEMIRKKPKKNKKGNKKKKVQKMKQVRLTNGTVIEVPKRKANNKRRPRKPEDLGEPTSIKNIRWKTYQTNENLDNVLYPQPIVEEYNFVKDG